MQKYILILLFSILANVLHGELVWTQEEGWHPVPHYAGFENESSEALKLMNSAKLDQINGNWGSALSKYSTVCNKFSDSIFAPEAYFQIGKIRVKKRQFNPAFKAFSTVTTRYPEYPHFNDVLREQFEIASMIKRGERPRYFGVIPGFKDVALAIGFYNKMLEQAPFSDLAPLALINIGELSLSKKQTLEAISAFERLIDEYPYSEYAPEGYLKLGEIYSNLIKSPSYDQGATRLAINFYNDFLTLYPGHPRAEEAKAAVNALQTKLAKGKILVGDFYFNSRNNRKAAILMFRSAKKSFPDSIATKDLDAKIDDIKNGKMPKKTPVDFLFGRYQRPKDEIYIEETIETKDNQKSILDGYLIRINSDPDPAYIKFKDPNAPKPNKNFLEVGPSKKF